MEKRQIIGVYTSHDSPEMNESLVSVLNELFTSPHYSKVLKNFWFVFTRGTYERILSGHFPDSPKLHPDVIKKLNKVTTLLPPRQDGGMTIMTYLVILDKCKTIWAFLTPYTPHPLLPQNRTLLQMCEQHDVQKLSNKRSVFHWIKNSERTFKHDSTIVPFNKIQLKSGQHITTTQYSDHDKHCTEVISVDAKDHIETEKKYKYLALVSDGDNKQQLHNFTKRNKKILNSNYHKILTNRTSIQIINDKDFFNKKVIECKRSEDGGYVEIAMEILFGTCKEVIFLENPEISNNSDNQILLGACYAKDDVLLFTKEKWAEDFVNSLPVKKPLKFIKQVKGGLDIDTNKMNDDVKYGIPFRGVELVVSKNKNGELALGVQ